MNIRPSKPGLPKIQDTNCLLTATVLLLSQVRKILVHIQLSAAVLIYPVLFLLFRTTFYLAHGLAWHCQLVLLLSRHLSCGWAYPKAQNIKKSDGSRQFTTLYVSSYQGAIIIHTQCQTHSWLNNAQNIAFLF